ncbi:MAG: hypothetical protein ACTSQI_10990 [Candidatus Helarchaeota archaeon]
MKEYKLIHKHMLGNRINHLAFSRNDRLIAATGESIYIGTIDGHALFEGKPKQDYEKHYWNLTKEVPRISAYEVKWSKDNKQLWIAAEDFYEFSIEKQQFRRIYKTKEKLQTIDINDTRELIALAGEGDPQSNKIYIFNFAGKLLHSIDSMQNRRVYSLMFSRDGTKIISAGRDYSLRVWNVDTGELLDQYDFDDNPWKLFHCAKDDQFIVQLRHNTSLFSLDASGKITLLKNLVQDLFVKKSKGLLGYSLKDDTVLSSAYFYETAHIHTLEGEAVANIEAAGQIDFIEPGNVHDILALVFKYQRPPEVHFYSTESKASFLQEDSIVNWEVINTYTKISDFLLVPYKKYPGYWIGSGTYYISVYDSDFNEIFKHRVRIQIYIADFHVPTQKMAYYQLNDQLHIIDFDALNLETIKKSKLNTHTTDVGKIRYVRWNHKGDKLAVVTDTKELVLYDANLKQITKKKFDENLFCLAWSTTDNKIAVGAENGLLYYYNLPDGTVKTIELVGIDRVLDLACVPNVDEFIATSNRFINILNQDGFIIRKLDLKKPIEFKFPSPRPGTSEFAVYGHNKEGHQIYFIDRNKPIRQCVKQIMRFHTDWIRMLRWVDSDTLMSRGGKIGLVVWRQI